MSPDIYIPYSFERWLCAAPFPFLFVIAGVLGMPFSHLHRSLIFLISPKLHVISFWGVIQGCLVQPQFSCHRFLTSSSLSASSFWQLLLLLVEANKVCWEFHNLQSNKLILLIQCESNWRTPKSPLWNLLLDADIRHRKYLVYIYMVNLTIVKNESHLFKPQVSFGLKSSFKLKAKPPVHLDYCY